jgi:IS30 family transposase
MSYSHLSASERFALYQYQTIDELTMDEIAGKMKRSKSTISRELRRNRLNEILYLPDTAQLKMLILECLYRKDPVCAWDPVAKN